MELLMFALHLIDQYLGLASKPWSVRQEKMLRLCCVKQKLADKERIRLMNDTLPRQVTVQGVK